MTFQPFIRQASLRVPADATGVTLLDYLAGRFPYHNRDAWRQLITTGKVLCNDRPATQQQLLASGDVIAYQPEPRPEPPVDFTAELLYQDDDLLALAKSANLPCHPAGCFFNHTLWAMLACPERQELPPPFNAFPALPTPHFVTRLDRETSGVIVIARNPTAARRTARLLQTPAAAKQYLVIIENQNHFPDALTANGWLALDTASAVRKKRGFYQEKPHDRAAETATTDFRRLAVHGDLALLTATLHTGRTHQIRATLAASGFPVVGDKIYGCDETIYLRFVAGQLTPDDEKRLRLPSQALHAWKITLPRTAGPTLTFIAPPPQTWRHHHDLRPLLAKAGLLDD
ncbi:MAG: RluA family pseudouridine synthase [Lentisphaerae bacterium]|nr:RluA family pseudouridine synthase [Lentisphaerota bacterium]OQC12003.1 MAG: Ribosomal large subunit pseudouridine synthase D [Lentisphaerae bacterium ADurb.Bin082]HQL88700.1 RluA family pseudouridine synthase [Lentisphaeria bacterium]